MTSLSYQTDKIVVPRTQESVHSVVFLYLTRLTRLTHSHHTELAVLFLQRIGLSTTSLILFPTVLPPPPPPLSLSLSLSPPASVAPQHSLYC